MFKIKMNFKQKRKKAQHIVEFAILMPIFIAFFCYMFPILTITYRNFRFSYFASNLVTRALENPQPAFYSNKDVWNPERFSDQIEEALPDNGERATTFLITKTPQTEFVSLGFRAPMRAIFGTIGNNYFYFMIPINGAFTEAPVFDIRTNDLNNRFEEYYNSHTAAHHAPSRPRSVHTLNRMSPVENGAQENNSEGQGNEGMSGALGG